jgi:hypothetical protein
MERPRRTVDAPQLGQVGDRVLRRHRDVHPSDRDDQTDPGVGADLGGTPDTQNLGRKSLGRTSHQDALAAEEADHGDRLGRPEAPGGRAAAAAAAAACSPRGSCDRHNQTDCGQYDRPTDLSGQGAGQGQRSALDPTLRQALIRKLPPERKAALMLKQSSRTELWTQQREWKAGLLSGPNVPDEFRRP